MAEEVSKGKSSTARSCNSKRSRSRGPVRVVHISNPTMIKTSASEFRSVVQSLTGRKRPCASGYQEEEMNLSSVNQHIPQVKKPKIDDGLQTLNDRKTSVSACIDDNATVSNFFSDKYHGGDERIFEELDVRYIQIPHYIPLQYQVFETLESVLETTNFVREKIWPSFL